MQKGDAYYIPVKLTIGGENISTGAVKVKIDTLTKTLTYDASINAWVFQLSQAETLAFPDQVQMQVGWKKDNDTYIYSDVRNVAVNDSLLGAWV